MGDVNLDVPVKFERVEQEDTRFQKVKIWLMHTGVNHNRSVFTREAVIKSIDSLKNTPILGFVDESSLGEKDFREHESEVVVKDGDYSLRYIGRAYGVITESCNPRFEKKVGRYGEELEYLVVDGLMWTKFDEALEVLNRDGEVGQSMELHDEYDGYFDENGNFVFTEFKFYGACLLGKDMAPAMQNASVEMTFSTDAIQMEIREKLKEYEEFLSKSEEVDSVTVEETTEESVSTEDTTVEEEVVEPSTTEETSTEEPVEEEVTTEVFAEEEKGEDEKKEDVKEDEEGKEEEEKKTDFKVKASKLQEKVDSLQSELNEVSTERDSLREFKENILKEQHQKAVEELIVSFDKLDEEDVKDIKENIHEFTVKEVESKLYERLGRKMLSFSKKEKPESGIHLKFSQLEPKSIGGHDHIFEKYGIK